MSKRSRIQFVFEYITDMFALFITSIASYNISCAIGKLPEVTSDDKLAYFFLSWISFTVIYLGFASSLNLTKRGRAMEILSVLRNTLLTFMSIAVLLLLTKNALLQSRYFFLISTGLYFILSSLGRYVLKRILIFKFAKSKMATLTGVITISERAEDFLQSFENSWDKKVVGIAILDAIEENGDYKYYRTEKEISEDGNVIVKYSEKLETVKEIAGVPVVANKDNFIKWVRSSSLDEIFINAPAETFSRFEGFIEEIESMGITVHINIPVIEKIVDASDFDNLKCEMFAGKAMATFTAKEISLTAIIFKRIFDIIISFFGCLFSIPVILITAIPLLIESKGPLIFKQPRVGKNGRIFYIYKLRSMYVDAEERKKELMDKNEMDGLMFKMTEDPRITKVGKFIRKTSIDELPQFFNVLKGDMSLIGTRPPTIDEFEKYQSHHKRRLSIKPGITGIWQVSGRSDIQDFEEIVRLDCEYIDNWSPALDIKILFKTVKVVLMGSGAK